MEKTKIIAEIIDLYDKVDKLTKENGELKTAKGAENPFEDLNKEGKKRLFNDIYSYSIKYNYDYDVVKQGKLLTFFEWLDTLDWDIFSTSYCKNNCSSIFNYPMKDLVNYFMNELREIYNEKLENYQKAKEETPKESENK